MKLSKHLQAWVSASGCGVVVATIALQNWAGRAVDGDTVAGMPMLARVQMIVSVKMAYSTIHTDTHTHTHTHTHTQKTDRDRDIATAVTNTA